MTFPATSSSGVPRHFDSIQYLRAIAALLVVFFHLHGVLERLGSTAGDLLPFLSGVDIFFVISGFVMWHSTSGRAISPWAFFRKRLARIVPLYWVVNLVMLAMLVLVPSAVRSGKLLPSHVVKSFLFVPAVHPFTGLIQPMLIPGWTLNAEMFFYVLFAVCLLLPAASRVPVATAMLLVPVALLHTVPHPGVMLQFYGRSIVLEFSLGLALGAAIERGWRPPLWLSWTGILAGTAVIACWFTSPPHLLAVGLPAAAVVMGAVGLERAGRLWRNRMMEFYGNASYSLYLVHGIAMSAIGQALGRLGMSAGTTAGAVVATVLLTGGALLVGAAVYQWVERPLTILFTGRKRNFKPAEPHGA